MRLSGLRRSSTGYLRIQRGNGRSTSMPGGETRGGSNPPFGTIAILKGNLAFRRSPFFRENGPSGQKVARRFSKPKEFPKDSTHHRGMVCISQLDDGPCSQRRSAWSIAESTSRLSQNAFLPRIVE